MKTDQAFNPREDLPMNTQAVTIQGKNFNIPAPYAEGHALTAAEASAVNQLYAENIRNNFAAKIKKAEEEKKDAPGQAELDSYCSTYQFGFRSAGQPKLDPITSEARKLAKVAVTDSLKKKNVKIKDMEEGQFEALIDGAIEKYPVFMERAKAIVEMRRSALDDLQVG